MKNRALSILILLLANFLSNAQSVGIGTTTPNSTALLHLNSTSRGFLMPRLTMAQRLAIPNPANGLQVFQTDTLPGVYMYNQNYWFVQPINQEINNVAIKQVYGYAPGVQKFVVPFGIKTVRILVNGAGGGVGSDSSPFGIFYYNGSPGKRISGLVNVNPGDTLVISTGVHPLNYTVAAFPDGSLGSQVIWYEGIFQHISTSGGSGGSTRVFFQDTTGGNLLIKSPGGNGGTEGHATPGLPVPHFISGLVQNQVIATDTPARQNGSVQIEYDLPSYLVANTGGGSGGATIAAANATGLLTAADWNTFNDKIGGSGNSSELAFFSATKTITSSSGLKWDNTNARLDAANIKITSLSGGATAQILAVDTSGKIVVTTFTPSGDNMGNHTALQTLNLNNNFLSNNGIKKGIKLDNNGYVGIAMDSTVTTFSIPLNVNSLNNGTGTLNWIASNIGGRAGGRVVSGTFNGMATIAAHTADISNWDHLKISPVGNVAVGDITPLVKLDVNGTLRAVNIGIGTTAPQRALDVRGDIAQGMWTDNIPSRRIGVMDNSTQVAGMEIENSSLGGTYSQKLHLLTHHFGGTFGRRLTIDEDGNVGIGTTTPTNKLSVQGNAAITGTFSTTGNATIGASLTAANISTTANATIAGSLSANALSAATVTTTGNATIGGTLTAANISTTANATITGSLTAAGITTGALSSTGNINGGGNADITGTLTTGTFSTTGNATIGGTLNASGISTTANATIAGSLSANTVSAATLTTTGGATIGGNLNAANITAGSNATITGALTAATITAGTVTANGNISATGNAGITGTLTAGTISTTGNISATNIASPKFKVTEIWSNVPGVPPVTNFTSGGGTIMLNISAMAFQTTGNPATLTIQVFVDGVNVTELKGFASQNSSQIPLTANFKILTGIAAGNHTISIAPVIPTQIDGNSYISASVLELPF